MKERKWVTGVWVEETKSFRDYTVHDFVTELEAFRKFDYPHLEAYFKKRGFSQEEFESFIQFEAIDEKTGNTKQYSLFDKIKNLATGKMMTGKGWGYMQRNFFGTTHKKIKQIRRNLGYYIRGGVEGDPIVFYGKPKHLFSNCYTNKMPIFDWFINYKFDTKYDVDIPEGHIIIRLFSWKDLGNGNFKNLYEKQHFDTHMRIDRVKDGVYEGGLETKGRLIFPLVDMFTNSKLKFRFGVEDTNYVELDLQQARTLIMEILQMSSNYKGGKAVLKQLNNAMKKFMSKGQPIQDCSSKMLAKLMQHTRIVPFNYERDDDIKFANGGDGSDAASTYFAGSFNHNPFDLIYSAKSRGDIYSIGSSFTDKEIAEVERELELYFDSASDKLVSEGVFCLDNHEFRKFRGITKYDPDYKLREDIPQTNMRSWNVMAHGSGPNRFTEQVMTFVKIFKTDTSADILGKLKKAIQRKRLEIGRKFKTGFPPSEIVLTVKGEEDSIEPLVYAKNIDYLESSPSTFFKINQRNTNCLVAYFEPHDYYPDMTYEVYTAMSDEEKLKFAKASPGVSGSTYFTQDFLHNNTLVPLRTEKISCRREELSEEMLEHLRRIDDPSQTPEEIDMTDSSINKYSDILLTHYSVNCPECKKGRMVEGEEGEQKVKNNWVRPTSEEFFCPICSHTMLNPAIGRITNTNRRIEGTYHRNAVVTKHFLAKGKKDYEKMVIKSYTETDDGIALSIDFFYDFANCRWTSPDLIKGVGKETKQIAVGIVKELKMRNPQTEEWITFKNVKLDALVFGPVVKGGEEQIMNCGLRLHNAVFGRKKDITGTTTKLVKPHEKFDVDGELIDLEYEPVNIDYNNHYIENDNPDFKLTELNKNYFQHFHRCPIEIEVYNPETDSKEIVTRYARVGLESLQATEISQEYRTTYTAMQNPHKISQVNLDMWHNFGFHEFCKELRVENLKSFQQNNEAKVIAELLNILTCLNNPLPAVDNAFSIKKKAKLSNALEDIKERNKENDSRPLCIADFQQEQPNRLTLSSLIPTEEYMKLRGYHPYLNEPIFEGGNYIEATFTRWTQEYGENGKTWIWVEKAEKYMLRLLSPETFYSLIKPYFSGFKVGLEPVAVAVIELFEMLSISQENPSDPKGALVLRASYNKVKKSNTPGLRPDKTTVHAIDNLKKQIYNYLLPKKGAFVVNTSINLPSLGGKLMCSPDVPKDVAIYSDDDSYREVVSDVIAGVTGDTQDWHIRENSVGWCWTFDLDAILHRNPPGPMAYQNMPHRVWSRFRANDEYQEMYGTTFDEEHPGCKGIVTQGTRSVADREEDEDGDWAELLFPYEQRGQKLARELREFTNKHMFKTPQHYEEQLIIARETEDELFEERILAFKYLAQNAGQARFDYLYGERKDAMVKYSDNMVYNLEHSKVPKQLINDATLEQREAKKDIGHLTNSLKEMILDLDYLYLLQNQNPIGCAYTLTKEAIHGIIFIFQYVLLQRNGVRAVKTNAPYGKITKKALILNEIISFVDPNGEIRDVPAQNLLLEALHNFDAPVEEGGYGTNLSRWHQTILSLINNFYISSVPGEGGGYKRVKVGKKMVTRFDWKGIYINEDYRDYIGLHKVMIGASVESFISAYGEDNLFRGIETEILTKIPIRKDIGEDFKRLKNLHELKIIEKAKEININAQMGSDNPYDKPEDKITMRTSFDKAKKVEEEKQILRLAAKAKNKGLK